MAPSGSPPPNEPGRPFGLALVAVAALALAVRVANLGTFSLWLDEILETRMAGGSLGAAWMLSLRGDVHPPAHLFLSWVLLALGAGETARRLVEVAVGVATVVLLARWAGRRFSPAVGLAAGLVAALSPLHVRYSQELRPYALALFASVLALDRLDAFLERPERRRLLGLALAVLLAQGSLYLAAVVAVPLAILAIDGWCRLDRPRSALGPVVATGLALAALELAWIGALVAAERPPGTGLEAGATDWTLDLFLRRIHFLTAAGVEGDAAGRTTAALVALLVIGATRAARSGAGLAVLAGALAGTLGVELALAGVGHWSNGRYDLMAWPYLVVLVALGVDEVGKLVGRGVGSRRAVTVATLLVALACEATGVVRYYLAGRPDWRAVAQVAERLGGPGVVRLAANEHTRVSASYYLPAESAPLRSVGGSLDELRRLRSPQNCTLVVVAAGWDLEPELARWARRRMPLAAFPSSDAAIYGLEPSDGACFAPVAIPPSPGERVRARFGFASRTAPAT